MDIDDDTDDTDDWSDYESGPFCQHWGDPSDCDTPCTKCGHKCCEHWSASDGCKVEGCQCESLGVEEE